MGKLFRGKDMYSEKQFENGEFENEKKIEDGLNREDDIEDEEEEEAIKGFETDSENNADESEDDSEDVDGSEEDADSEDVDGPEEGADSEDVDDSEEKDDFEEAYEFEDDSEDDEDDEDDRRMYRRRRRIRNQVIAYSIVFVILAAVMAGGVSVGRNVAGMVKEKKLAEEQAAIQAQLQAEQEAEAAHDVVIDTPSEPIMIEPEPEVDELDVLVEPYISEMPLEDKVAGLFIVTPETLTGVRTVTQAGEGTQDALNEYAVGGLIYFGHNIIDEEQLRTMLASTASMSRYPIFLAVDEEGGSVSRVAASGIDVIQVGDMAEIGESGDVGQAYWAGLTIGAYLKDLGFNLDFAPVADVKGSENSVMGDRTFGSDAQMVADMVSNVVDGIEENGVSSCLKHFPGIGYTEGDTHSSRVEVTRTLDKMRGIDFIPFQAGIDAGVDFVMVSHITVEDTGDAVPSSLSKTIMTDILRNEMGFQGVIITDALDMAAITEYYTTEEAAVGAIMAGADMLLMPDDFYTAYDAVLEAVQNGTISEERINESLRRIYRVKCADKLN